MSSVRDLSGFDARRVVRSALSLGSGEVLSRAVSFAGTAFAARTLGPEGFGVVGFATAVVGYFGLAVSAGFNDVGAREIARAPERAKAIVKSALAVRLALAALACGVLVLVVAGLDKPPFVSLVIALTGATLFSTALDSSWAYKGLERTGRVAVARMLAQLTTLAVIVASVRSPADAVWVPVAQFAGELVSAAFLALGLVQGPALPLELATGWELVKESRFTLVTKLSRTVIFTFDSVVLGLFHGEAAVGWYGAPYRVCYLLIAVGGALHASLLAATVRARSGGPPVLSAVVARSLALVTLVGCPLVLGGLFTAEALLELLFGAAYVRGAGAFRWLLVSVACIFLHGIAHNLLLACDRLATETRIMLAGAFVNVVANAYAIPRFGIEGAAAATAASEFVVLLGCAGALRAQGVRFAAFGLHVPLLASGAMAAVLAVTPDLFVIVRLLLAATAYAAVALSTGAHRIVT